MTIEITNLLHVAVIGTDLDRSIEFYSNVLGFAKIDRALKYPGAWYQVGELQIHIIINPDYQLPPVDLNISTRNPHFALGVKDLDAIASRLVAANYPVKMSSSGRAALFTQDPDGNVIEFTLQP
jgi:glyoxylase I family protein